ncbi:hypothetical protein LCGC14_3082620 [marine sediment metagenome]|uniref:Uncharacterized protein n=1 Tax=marine sediment metagenome TaxID=412755 RepID=A0A0F8WDN7_9ZZZZ
MMQFAVQTPDDLMIGKARWVLAVDPMGEQFLVADKGSVLRWVPMKWCKFHKLIDPEAPQSVIPMAPKGVHLVKGQMGHLPRPGDGS